jgi:hypothetical protein
MSGALTDRLDSYPSYRRPVLKNLDIRVLRIIWTEDLLISRRHPSRMLGPNSRALEPVEIQQENILIDALRLLHCQKCVNTRITHEHLADHVEGMKWSRGALR